MKKTLLLIMIMTLVGALGFFSNNLGRELQKTDQQATVMTAPDLSNLPPRAYYDPGGRRDPFKDLLGGGKGGSRGQTEGGQLSIANATLVGIVKTQRGFVAIISGPQQMPYFLKIGDKVSDGYIFDINHSQVIFRKTHERGFPLMRPINVVKEINPEER
ncbi:MAG: hypothetical protein PHU81_04710 [Acidobacteriota bacterium]|nr:hypothetical protein [Acidobacteriota bacterium]